MTTPFSRTHRGTWCVLPSNGWIKSYRSTIPALDGKEDTCRRIVPTMPTFFYWKIKSTVHFYVRCFWLRGPDLNWRPSGYEPDSFVFIYSIKAHIPHIKPFFDCIFYTVPYIYYMIRHFYGDLAVRIAVKTFGAARYLLLVRWSNEQHLEQISYL